MSPTILSQKDLDDIARQMADEDLRYRAVFWRCTFGAVAFVVAVLAWGLL